MRLGGVYGSCTVTLVARGAWAGGSDVLSKITETRIIVTTATESYPRITEAPILRRKLGSNKWDLIHEGIQGQKRNAVSCPSNYQLCPKSLSGGCCPSDRVCGTSSCYATSTAPASACGQAGYVACGAAQGGKLLMTSYRAMLMMIRWLLP
jgi:hypothetical protein